ncbi:protein of unknown function [Lachnospiraceae bacterium]|nr:protein of unknown function [Lachnospiraceae bacterium]
MMNTYNNTSDNTNQNQSINNSYSGQTYNGTYAAQTINGVNAAPPYIQRVSRFQEAEAVEVQDFREKMARKLGIGSLIYAAVFTFCLYNNLTGVTMPFFGIATLVYMIYALKLYNIQIKKLSWFYGSILMALTISNFLTGNLTFHFFNTVGILIMLFIFLLHNVYDDSRWNFSKTFISCFEAFFCSIGEMDDFTKDMKVLKQRKKVNEANVEKRNTLKYIFIGLLISVPLAGIILLLLSSADKVFNLFLSKYLSFDFNISTFIGIIITFAFSFFGSYCILRFFSKKTIREEVTSHRNMEPVIAITVLSIISVIYLFFSMIQIIYLFWGGMKLPNNYSYSDYAREGFFQLLAVSIINFLMVLFVNSYFRESRILKVLMTVISGCTYIMIASSCMRMLIYIDACLLTSLRIWVLWGLAVLSLLFVAVIISIYKNGFPLFKYSIIVVGIMYALISFAHPDYIIADYNLKYMNTIEPEIAKQDYEYLTELSTDAAPVIYEYNTEWADQYFANNKYFYKEKGLRKFNLSGYTARVLSENR